MRLYLDHNATSPLKPEARAAMHEVLDLPLNASSVHGEGRAARARLDAARASVAALAGARAEQVLFTSGATEANNWVLRGHAGWRVVVSSIEHSSVLEAAPSAERFPVTGDGTADLAALDALLTLATGPALVSLMLVNNESGVIQPVAEAARIVHRHGGRLHVDAVQGAGKLALEAEALGADFLTLSAHKIGGPQGIGALVMTGLADLPPWSFGGRQENRRRAGTENIAGAAGFGVAAALATCPGEENARLEGLRDQLQRELLAIAPQLVVAGLDAPRVGSTLLFALPGLPAETQVIALDVDGIAVSAGAACSSGKVEPSHVLSAMGYDETVSRCAIRVSLGWNSTEADVARFVASWQKLYGRHAARVARTS